MIIKLFQYVIWQNDEKPKRLEDYIYTLFCWFIVVFWEYFLYRVAFNLKGEYLIFIIFPIFFAINVLFSGVVLKIKENKFSIDFILIGILGLYYAKKHATEKENKYV